jgi:hypothetical protein
MDLREIGLGGVDWIRLAQDRDRWRAVVSVMMNLRRLNPDSSQTHQHKTVCLNPDFRKMQTLSDHITSAIIVSLAFLSRPTRVDIIRT